MKSAVNPFGTIGLTTAILLFFNSSRATREQGFEILARQSSNNIVYLVYVYTVHCSILLYKAENSERGACMVTHIARVWINRVRMVADPARGKLNR